MSYTNVCAESDITVGQLAKYKVDGESVVIYHLEDGFYATQKSCPHTFGPLDRGKIIEGSKIQCPLHRAEFDIKSGQAIKWANFPPGIQLLNALRKQKCLKTFPVKVENGQVSVDVSDVKLANAS